MAVIIPVEVFDCIVFGATGDLTLRKLLPALYFRYRDGQVPEGSRIIGAARSQLDDDGYREKARAALQRHIKPQDLDAAVLDRFIGLVHYAQVNGAKDEGWPNLTGLLEGAADRVRVFYLATSPELYGPTCDNLDTHGLITPRSRVVLEKPIGHDLES
ncbi:MAG: glucose-6-phosphate dehydrogenase, partial [Janthinobacterium lividum]